MHKGFNNLEEFIDRHDRFIISTHESPDADGLGGALAFREFLEKSGNEAIILNSDPTPAICRFMDMNDEINVYSEGYELPPDIDTYAQFVLDTNDFDNIGDAYHQLKNLVRETLIIDHHEGDRDTIERNFIQVEASSVSEIVYDIIEYYGYADSLSFMAAQALYTGMVFDTGSFRYPKTSSNTLRIASKLLEKGIKPNEVYQNLYESNDLSGFLLKNQVLATMEILHNGQMVIMSLTPEMVQQTGGKFSEGEATINSPLTVRGVMASVLVKQDVDMNMVKVSMRTKGDFNVAQIALANGGGGHKNAAGYKSNLSFEETYQKVRQEVGAFFHS